MVFLLSIASKYLLRHKTRNIFTILTIIIGVALVIGVNTTLDSVITQYQATASKATGNVDISITSLEDTFNQTILNDITSIDGVTNVSARLNRITELIDQNKTITIIGINSETDFEFQSLNFSKKTLNNNLTSNSTEIAVSSNLNYSLGQTIQIRFYNETAIGDTGLTSISEKTSIPYNFSITNTYSSKKNQIYADLSKIQEICNLTGKIDSINIKITTYERTNQIVGDLNTKLGSTYIINQTRPRAGCWRCRRRICHEPHSDARKRADGKIVDRQGNPRLRAGRYRAG